MVPRLTLTRRITIAILLGLFGSVLLVMLFSSVFARIVYVRKPPSDAIMYPASAMLVEAASDAALRVRIVEVLKGHYPGHSLTVYTADGTLLATTMAEPIKPLVAGPSDWGALQIEMQGSRMIEIIPVMASSGARFYALHDAGDKVTPVSGVVWFWIVCFIPVLCLVVASLLLARSITRPLDRIVDTARALADGQLTARVGIDRPDELGLLASTLDRMAERITTLLRARTELLALVSHELRTPLARIRVALDIAVAGNVDRARDVLSSMGGDLAELDRLLGDTLTYSRLELVDRGGAGTLLNLEEVDLVALIKQAASRFSDSWPGRSLELDLEPELPLLDADRVLLMRVVLNLLENAAKYSPAEQPIALRVSSADEKLLLEVVDRGQGIDVPDLLRAFEPFFRAQTARGNATAGGLGLGLTLCRRVIEAHGGTIEAHATPDGGTTMRVHFPTGR